MTKDEFEQRLQLLLAPHGIDVVEVDVVEGAAHVRASIGGRIALGRTLGMGSSGGGAAQLAQCFIDLADAHGPEAR